MGSVAKEWSIECPNCGDDLKLDIVAKVHVRLVADGTDINAPDVGDHEWDETSQIFCRNCGKTGTVKEFKLDKNATEYTVLFKRLVEETAELCVRATDADDARRTAVTLIGNDHVELAWGDGDDGSTPEIYCIKDVSGEIVFQD